MKIYSWLHCLCHCAVLCHANLLKFDQIPNYVHPDSGILCAILSVFMEHLPTVYFNVASLNISSCYISPIHAYTYTNKWNVILQPLLDDFLEICSVNRVPVFIIDPIVLKSIQKNEAGPPEHYQRHCSHLCQKSSITLAVLESNLSPDGLNSRVSRLYFHI